MNSILTDKILQYGRLLKCLIIKIAIKLTSFKCTDPLSTYKFLSIIIADLFTWGLTSTRSAKSVFLFAMAGLYYKSTRLHTEALVVSRLRYGILAWSRITHLSFTHINKLQRLKNAATKFLRHEGHANTFLTFTEIFQMTAILVYYDDP